jgi:hypothetical protein
LVAAQPVHHFRQHCGAHTLLRWYRAGIDPMCRLLHLSTFLGHVSPSSTAVYLTITTELLGCANERFCTFRGEQPEGVCPMNVMNAPALGPVLSSFFNDYLKLQKGLRPNSIRSYADAMRLFLQFAAKTSERKITQLGLDDLDADLVSKFLNFLVEGNAAQSRNLRLAALRTFFEYVGQRFPERLGQAQKVAAIPTKRTQLPEAHFPRTR